ncbi:hypothetical protein Vretimale_11701 [Volvox reticuliferus]|uniref:WW domain-containing protein n=1 Tax=Volvox reticuliferus TaxID=1737510 RepID=A0A8J4G0G1_9CHLO|nr:hypothetical protein Vretifemale_20959 [Volvox reticuliferus]GIM07620.1 hypothetical protein Vretimale_11701 [Volvox reticuliferus]
MLPRSPSMERAGAHSLVHLASAFQDAAISTAEAVVAASVVSSEGTGTVPLATAVDEGGRKAAVNGGVTASRPAIGMATSEHGMKAAKAEQEKGALQEQIAKTMRMFQEQLVQMVKMAAMLQAQRILGAARGGAVPMGTLGGTLMAQSSNGSIGLNTGGLVAQQTSMGLDTMGMNLPGTAGSLTSAPGMNLTGTLSASPSMGAAAAAATASMLPQPVAALPGDVDDPPTQDEIVAYGKYLGMDVVEDADLLYIAEWALTAPLPVGWTAHLDGEGNEFFYNAATNASTYEHPMDEHYRAYYRKMKEQKQLARKTEAQQ